MKHLLFYFIVSIFISSNNTKETETLKLYQQALCDHLETVNDIDTVYIMKSFDLEFPVKVRKYHIIDATDTLDMLLQKKTSLYVIKILPIEVNEGNIEIGFIDYGVTKEKGEIIMAWSGSKIFTYKYIAKTKHYKLINTKKYTI
jgi:hypothetical protein